MKMITMVVLLLVAAMTAALPGRAQGQAEGRKLYAGHCSTCHGDKGQGDGVAAGALPVKPQDHTNGAVMNSLSDQFLADIIANGGGSVGKSSFMPGWRGSLNDKQIRDLVAYIRTLAVPPYQKK